MKVKVTEFNQPLFPYMPEDRKPCNINQIPVFDHTA